MGCCILSPALWVVLAMLFVCCEGVRLWFVALGASGEFDIEVCLYCWYFGCLSS